MHKTLHEVIYQRGLVSSPVCQVNVVNPDGTPAKDVELVLTSERTSNEGRTKENGMAMFSVNTLQDHRELSITVSFHSYFHLNLLTFIRHWYINETLRGFIYLFI